MSSVFSPYYADWVADATHSGLMPDPARPSSPHRSNTELRDLLIRTCPESVPISIPLLRALGSEQRALLVQVLLSRPAGTPLRVGGQDSGSIEGLSHGMLDPSGIRKATKVLQQEGLLRVQGKGHLRRYTLTPALGERLNSARRTRWQAPGKGVDMHAALSELVTSLDRRFLLARSRVVALTGSLGSALVFEALAYHLAYSEAQGNADGGFVSLPVARSTGRGTSLLELCPGFACKATLYRCVDTFVSMGWLDRRVRFTGAHAQEERFYRLGPSLKSALDGGKTSAQKNNVPKRFFRALKRLFSRVFDAILRQKFSKSVQNRNQYLYPKGLNVISQKETTGEPCGTHQLSNAPVALRALSAQFEPEQQTAPSEDEQGVTPPQVGGEASQPSREANPAVRPVEPPAMREVAPEALIGSAAPGATLGSQEVLSESQAASLASCETSANPDAPSPEAVPPSPASPQEGPVKFQTDAKGGAARDPFLAELLEGEAREGDEAAQRATQEAQEAALLALSGPAPLRANVCQELRDGFNFAERNGKWHLPAVRNLLERPQRPVAFKEAVRGIIKELRKVKPKQRPEGTPLQLRALDSLVGLSSVQKNGLFGEPIKEGVARAEGWQRLEREEIKLAVELLPRVHVDTDPDGKEIKAVTTLIQLLDMLAGGDKPREERTAGTPKAAAKGAAGPDPKRIKELERLDRERLLRSEREADQQHADEQAALLISEPETQWERARTSLKMLTRGLLDDGGFTQLEKRCREGLISAAELLKGLTKPGDRRAVLDAHLGPVSAGHLGVA